MSTISNPSTTTTDMKSATRCLSRWHVRANTTLRSFDILGRLGGEEFAAVLPETNEETARTVAERLRSAIEEKLTATSQGSIHITVSLGLCAFDRCDVHSVDDMLRIADKGLYLAKENGRKPGGNAAIRILKQPAPFSALFLAQTTQPFPEIPLPDQSRHGSRQHAFPGLSPDDSPPYFRAGEILFLFRTFPKHARTQPQGLKTLLFAAPPGIIDRQKKHCIQRYVALV